MVLLFPASKKYDKILLHSTFDYRVMIIIVFTIPHFSLCFHIRSNNSNEVIAWSYCDEPLPKPMEWTINMTSKCLPTYFNNQHTLFPFQYQVWLRQLTVILRYGAYFVFLNPRFQPCKEPCYEKKNMHKYGFIIQKIFIVSKLLTNLSMYNLSNSIAKCLKPIFVLSVKS